MISSTFNNVNNSTYIFIQELTVGYMFHIVMDTFMYKFKVTQEPYSSEPFNINSQIIIAVKKYFKSADKKKERILDGFEGNDKGTRRLIKLIQKKTTIIG